MSTREEVRLRFRIQYDGSRFFGWQLQPDARTVQGELQAVVTRLTGGDRPRSVIGSGRTDRGVHALGQVAVADVPARWTPDAFRRAMNALLPPDVWIAAADRVPADFHPRYDATHRTYAYRLGMTEDSHSPFHRAYCWPLAEPVDLPVLDRLARRIPGERSFAAFAKSGQPERGTRCRVMKAHWEPWEPGDGPRGRVFRITADRYLHHMVRYLVGTMVEVGRGRRPAGDFEELLEGTARGLTTSPPAPPQGLFLEDVGYPDPGDAGRPESGRVTAAPARSGSSREHQKPRSDGSR